MKTYIGVDLGGTNVRAAKVDEQGNLLQVVKQATEIDRGVDHVIQKIISMIESIDGYEHCVGIGMGVPGPVDTKNGKMMLASFLPGFEGYPLVKHFQDHFHMPVYMDNDVNVACMGEAMLGAGKEHDSVYYVTLSTGVGGALVIDRKVVSGAHGFAGEIGNVIIDRNREDISHLNVGAVENEASGTAITRKGKALFGEDQIAHAGDVFDLARRKDKRAVQLCSDATYDLAQLFSIIAHICDPEVFVLGGGLMKGKDVFLHALIDQFKQLIHEGMRAVEFKEAQLEEPGIVGAAMLVKAYEGRNV